MVFSIPIENKQKKIVFFNEANDFMILNIFLETDIFFFLKTSLHFLKKLVQKEWVLFFERIFELSFKICFLFIAQKFFYFKRKREILLTQKRK